MARILHNDCNLFQGGAATHLSPGETQTHRVLFQLVRCFTQLKKSLTCSLLPPARAETANQIKAGLCRQRLDILCGLRGRKRAYISHKTCHVFYTYTAFGLRCMGSFVVHRSLSDVTSKSNAVRAGGV